MTSSLAAARAQNAKAAKWDAKMSITRLEDCIVLGITLGAGCANHGPHQFPESLACIGRLIIGAQKLHHRFSADGMFGDDFEREQRGRRQHDARDSPK